MIEIDNILIHDEVIEAQFVCDLNKCKGACCVDGDTGAPITQDESEIITKVLPIIKEYLPDLHIKEIEKQGTYLIDDEFGLVTPTINNGICVYAFKDDHGIVKCAFEAAYLDNKIDFKKPISCHLFPIRIQETKIYELVNYEPREKICDPACVLGKKLKVPVYQFLKEPLIRKYGVDFYETLNAVASYKKESGEIS